MQCTDTAKPATALHGEPAPEFVGSGGLNSPLNSETRIALQVARLTRRCAISAAMAEALAPLAFGVTS